VFSFCPILLGKYCTSVWNCVGRFLVTVLVVVNTRRDGVIFGSVCP